MNTTLLRKIIILIIIQIKMIGIVNAIEISFNNSENLPIVGNIIYVYQSDPSSMNFQIDTAIVCTSINASSLETLIVAINDANNLPINTLNHNILSTQYDLANALVSIGTDDGIQCATQNGIITNALFANGFEETDLQLSLFDGNGIPFPVNITLTNQQIFNYQYVIDNNGTIALSTDLGEFYRLDNANPFFSGVVDDDWTCTAANTGTGSTTTCGDFITGNGFVRLKNASVDPNEQLIINVSRTVEIPVGSIETTIELLGAAFTLTDSDIDTDNNIIFQVFDL